MRVFNKDLGGFEDVVVANAELASTPIRMQDALAWEDINLHTRRLVRESLDPENERIRDHGPDTIMTIQSMFLDGRIPKEALDSVLSIIQEEINATDETKVSAEDKEYIFTEVSRRLIERFGKKEPNNSVS